jgi:hypothetical protein
MFSDLDGLQHGLRQLGDGHGRFGLDVALQSLRKDLAETTREIARGEIVAGDPGADTAAALASEGHLGFFLFVKVAERGLRGGARRCEECGIGGRQRR